MLCDNCQTELELIGNTRTQYWICPKCDKTSKLKIIDILIGLPRSGKSTYRNQFAEERFVISADDIRYKVYGQRFFADGESLMWSIREIILKTAMEQGINILVDETNTTVKRRKAIIDLAKKYGYIINGIWIQTSKEECIKRAEKENDSYIIPVIEKMAKQFEEPNKDEGFDWIYKYE